MTPLDDRLRIRIAKAITRMQPGEAFTLDRRDLFDIPSNPFTGESPVDRILALVIGSNYNVRVSYGITNDTITFHKMEETGTRWNADPDRRHLFVKQADGSLVHRDRSKP